MSGFRYRSALERAGIRATNKGYTFARLMLLAIPLPIILTRNIERKLGETYATVPRSLRNESVLRKLKLDVYWHKNRRLKNAPVFLYIHGGGWVTGHRAYHSIPLLYQIARSGWVVVTINYRLCPRVRAYPDQLIDCKRGLAWIRENAHKFSADGNFVICGGESAGGHLATLLALTPNDPAYQPGFESVDTSVQGCVNLYGVMDFTDTDESYMAFSPNGKFRKFIEKIVMKQKLSENLDIYKKASPYWRLHDSETIPRIMTVHGTNDTLVPFQSAKTFNKLLSKIRLQNLLGDSVEVDEKLMSKYLNTTDVFVQLPGAHHAFNFVLSPRSLALADAVWIL